jgi:hypothetical protein
MKKIVLLLFVVSLTACSTMEKLEGKHSFKGTSISMIQHNDKVVGSLNGEELKITIDSQGSKCSGKFRFKRLQDGFLWFRDAKNIYVGQFDKTTDGKCMEAIDHSGGQNKAVHIAKNGPFEDDVYGGFVVLRICDSPKGTCYPVNEFDIMLKQK